MQVIEVTINDQPKKRVRRTSMDNWKDKRWRDRAATPKKRGPKKKRYISKEKPKPLIKQYQISPIKGTHGNNKVIHIYSVNKARRSTELKIDYIRCVPNVNGLQEFLSTVGLVKKKMSLYQAVSKFDSGEYGLHKPYENYLFIRNEDVHVKLFNDVINKPKKPNNVNKKLSFVLK